MINLSSPPAFGFETKHCNADQVRYDRMVATHKELLEKSGETETAQEEKIIATARESIVKDERFKANVLKGLGYVPLIGMGVGIYTLIKSIQAESQELPNKRNHIIRSFIVMSNFGFFLLIPDLLVTSYRDHKAKALSSRRISNLG